MRSNDRGALRVLWVGLTLLHLLSFATNAAVMEGGEGEKLQRKHNATNVVILLADNLAYDDVGIFQGSHGMGGRSNGKNSKSKTPNLDRAAMEGRRLLNWNSPAVLCSASRAALLTGELVSRYEAR